MKILALLLALAVPAFSDCVRPFKIETNTKSRPAGKPDFLVYFGTFPDSECGKALGDIDKTLAANVKTYWFKCATCTDASEPTLTKANLIAKAATYKADVQADPLSDTTTGQAVLDSVPAQ